MVSMIVVVRDQSTNNHHHHQNLPDVELAGSMQIVYESSDVPEPA